MGGAIGGVLRLGGCEVVSEGSRGEDSVTMFLAMFFLGGFLGRFCDRQKRRRHQGIGKKVQTDLYAGRANACQPLP